MKDIIVVEDQKLFRMGLISILEAQDEIKVVQEYQNGKDFIESIENETLPSASIIFLDISMPWLSGLEVLQIIQRKGYILPPICMLSMYPDQFYLHKVKELGAKGYLNKDSEIDQLTEAIDIILDGGTFFSDEKIKNKINTSVGFLENLSEREITVFTYLTQGMTVKEIAYELDVSVKTISTYKTRLMTKLGTDTLSDLLKLSLLYNHEV